MSKWLKTKQGKIVESALAGAALALLTDIVSTGPHLFEQSGTTWLGWLSLAVGAGALVARDALSPNFTGFGSGSVQG